MVRYVIIINIEIPNTHLRLSYILVVIKICPEVLIIN